VLVDTDVLIWHLRGYRQAAQRLDRLSELSLSVVSYLELIQGMRNKAELAAVQKMLALRFVLSRLADPIQHAIQRIENRPPGIGGLC